MALRVTGKIMHIHPLRVTFPPPRPPLVLKGNTEVGLPGLIVAPIRIAYERPGERSRDSPGIPSR